MTRPARVALSGRAAHRGNPTEVLGTRKCIVQCTALQCSALVHCTALITKQTRAWGMAVPHEPSEPARHTCLACQETWPKKVLRRVPKEPRKVGPNAKPGDKTREARGLLTCEGDTLAQHRRPGQKKGDNVCTTSMSADETHTERQTVGWCRWSSVGDRCHTRAFSKLRAAATRVAVLNRMA